MDRAATCLVELLTSIPDGVDAVPDAGLDGAGRADRHARPEHYARDWLTVESDRYLELIERSIAQAPRIWSLRGVVTREGERATTLAFAHRRRA